MTDTYNIYCDESCHLEHDPHNVMLLGAVWCVSSQVSRISSEIRLIKEKNNARGELKWIKVSPSRLDYFHSIVDYFFSEQALHFRCLVVNDKGKLDHSFYNKGSHDSFYYKMYFYLLRNIIKPENKYRVFLDIKDSRSQVNLIKLGEVIMNNFLDFERKSVQKIQQIRSIESELMQLTDFLLGAVSYRSRNLKTSEAKLSIVRSVSEYSGLTLSSSTPPWEEKFNVFYFSPH